MGKSYGDDGSPRSFTASVRRGEKIALMGRNGAGKTTLLNALLANSPTTPEAELRKTSGTTVRSLSKAKSFGDTRRKSGTLRRTIAR